MKMVIKIKIILSVLLCSLISMEGYSQTITYTVSDDSPGTINSIDQILPMAVTDANNGYTVIVYFNAPGLCQVAHQLAPVNISNGSISFEKHPAATAVQGIVLTATTDPTIMYGFKVSNTAGSQYVYFKNLMIKDFSSCCGSFPTTLRSGIDLYKSQNVLIENCEFVNNYVGVFNSKSINLLVENCLFTDNNGSIVVQEDTPNADFFDSKITNCTVQSSPGLESEYGIVINRRINNNNSMNHTVTIENNLIKNTSEAGVIVDNDLISSVTDPGFKVFIRNNTFEDNSGFSAGFQKPFKHFVFENNSFNNFKFGIFINSATNGLPNPFGIDFVESNTFGYPLVNSGNYFGTPVSSSSIAINIAGFHGEVVNIIGLDLPAMVRVEGDYPAIIRENKIVSNQQIDLPIQLANPSSNLQIASPHILGVAQTTNNLSIDYILGGAQIIQANADFVVEFFISDQNGDLIEYLGSSTISTLTGSSYNFQATVPPGYNLYPNGRIATTVTAYRNHSIPVGTSEASYSRRIIISEPPISCENCIGSFAPEENKTYLISSWVKEENAPLTKTSYTFPKLSLSFTTPVNPPSSPVIIGPFQPAGEIIDGWQRIEAEFTVPNDAIDMNIVLSCQSGDCYFDDVRVLPFDGSMKSYVYDPVTLRLVAELDERNYATFYEYDDEGKLVRIKKETERGIMTIQESKTSVVKQ